MQLKHHIIGVDIGSHSIKIVNLKRIKDETVAVIAVEEVYPNDFELAGSDSKLLSNFIKSIFKKINKNKKYLYIFARQRCYCKAYYHAIG